MVFGEVEPANQVLERKSIWTRNFIQNYENPFTRLLSSRALPFNFLVSLHNSFSRRVSVARTTRGREADVLKMCGCCDDTTANATRDFWPPHRAPMDCAVIPIIQTLPRRWWYPCSIFPEPPSPHGVTHGKHRIGCTGKAAYTRSLPLRLREANKNGVQGRLPRTNRSQGASYLPLAFLFFQNVSRLLALRHFCVSFHTI